MLWVPGPLRRTAVTDAVKFVFFLKFGNFPLQPLFREAQRVHELFEFRHSAHHARAVDDQFSDCIHHAVEPRQRNSNRLNRGGSARSLFRGLLGRCGALRGGFDFLLTRRFAGNGRRRRGLCFFGVERGKLRDSAQQGIDTSPHFDFVGPLPVEGLL